MTRKTAAAVIASGAKQSRWAISAAGGREIQCKLGQNYVANTPSRPALANRPCRSGTPCSPCFIRSRSGIANSYNDNPAPAQGTAAAPAAAGPHRETLLQVETRSGSIGGL